MRGYALPQGKRNDAKHSNTEADAFTHFIGNSHRIYAAMRGNARQCAAMRETQKSDRCKDSSHIPELHWIYLMKSPRLNMKTWQLIAPVRIISIS
jgi:hypothetical protein